MTDIWAPLSTRQGDGEVLRDDVPDALDAALRLWIEKVARRTIGLCERILLRCDLVRAEEHGPEAEVDNEEFLAWYTPKDRLLDVVDAFLDLLPPRIPGRPTSLPALPMPPDRKPGVPGVLETMTVGFANIEFRKHRDPLQQLLNDGRSAYTVRPDGRALIRRVDAAMTKLVMSAARAAEQPDRGSASIHLQRAYAAAYALHPDTVRAYSEAVKAVESAVHATLSPNNTRATLGNMLGDLPQQRKKLTVALAGQTDTEGMDMVEAMMRLLWTGQISRH